LTDVSATVDHLCQTILERDDGHKRLMVAIAGPPGAGKSTVADALAVALNQRLPDHPAEVVPMDGFHYDNALLDARHLRARKGAPETFDADGFLALLRRLRTENGDIATPVFDRNVDLSRGSARIISRQQRLLIIEGNYLLLNRPVWQELPAFFDVTVFLQPSIEAIEARLIQRWLDHGLDPEAATLRARGNDLANAKIVLAESRPADITLLQ
jgi:pantothenate kinase